MRYMKTSLILTLLLGMILSCEESNELPEATASLSFAVEQGSLAKAANDHVALDSVKILLKTIQFHSVDESDSMDYKSDPQVVRLDLAGGVNTLSASAIPMGTYDKVSFRIHKPEDTETPSDPDFKIGDSGNERFSIIAGGTHDGQAFLFRSSKSSKQRVNIDPPLVVEEEGLELNVTLSVDVSTWFIDEDGEHLNPLDEGDENEIDKAIRRSFKGFRDDDRDGS